jgi:hypothetical protein
MEAETKLSHFPGPGRIHLREGMVAELAEHCLELFVTTHSTPDVLWIEPPPGLIESRRETVGIAELSIRFRILKERMWHVLNPSDQNNAKPCRQKRLEKMPGPRFELGTRRFSVACSTN